MDVLISLLNRVNTPAFVLGEKAILEKMELVDQLKQTTGCKVLYALKPLANPHAMQLMLGHVDGFAASSLFEATLAREVIGKKGIVSITTPAYRADEVKQLTEICDHVVLNSISQLKRFRSQFKGKSQCGLRINPQLSYVKDERYNPCRTNSKLGIHSDELIKFLEQEPEFLASIGGLHFHSNCDSDSFNPLLETVQHLTKLSKKVMDQIEWVNLGGGYLLEADNKPLRMAIDLLKSKPGLEVYLEPGATIVREAGYIVSSVIDLVPGDDTTIAVLDTSVNHMPEVFEYQFEPDILEHDDKGKYDYLLAGGTCLAGDIFGQYTFSKPLEIGSRITFSDAGAYTQVKAHMFNGINLPTVYVVTQGGELKQLKRYQYQDFLSRCGV